MIRGVRSDRPTFKGTKFQPGLNIILARRSPTSTSGDKRNAVGKSSFIDVVHFLFGGKVDSSSPLAAPELAEDSFQIDFDIAGSQTTISRSLAQPSRIQIEGDFLKWPLSPDINEETGDVTMTVEMWRDLLGRSFFDLPPVSQIQAGSYLSFRSCFSYFARRQRGDGYADWRRHFAMQRPVDYQVNLAYLFGLDYEAPFALHQVKEKEAAKKQLRKALKQGLMGLAIETPGKLRTRHRKVRNQVERLDQQLDGFRIVDAYEELESQANERSPPGKAVFCATV